MPVRGLFHDEVRHALEKDGWTITHDPYRLKWGGKDTYVDLGATRLVAAQRDEELIAVEIKSFIGRSEMEDLEQAVGQYMVYAAILRREDPGRTLFLAIPNAVLLDIFKEPVGTILLSDYGLKLIGFEPASEVIVEWIH